MATNFWSDAELEAAVGAYFRMFDKQTAGEPYVKAEIRRAVAAGSLANRGEKSFEFRMQNISHVMETLGPPWVEGYRPPKNVGRPNLPRIQKVVEKALEERT